MSLSRLFRGGDRLHARADWADFAGADWASRIMRQCVTDDFHAKQGRSTGRLVLRHGLRRLAVYLKRHYQLPRLRGLLAALWPGGDWSPAMQERKRLAWTEALGIPVPRVVAAGEFLAPWGRLQSFLAVEELSGMIALHRAIPLASEQLDGATFRRWKMGLAGELARLARLLHDRRRFHKDLYLCHFFVAEDDITQPPDDWTGRVTLIDLQRLTHHAVLWPWYLVKDLAQLLYSTHVEGIADRDRLAFWRTYLGPLRDTWSGRLLLRCVRLKGRRYRDHNEKSKAQGRRPVGCEQGGP